MNEMALLWGLVVVLIMGCAFNSVRIEKLEEELSTTRNELAAAKQRCSYGN